MGRYRLPAEKDDKIPLHVPHIYAFLCPIAIAAFFKKVEWTPIQHSVTMSIDEMTREEEKEEQE